MCHCTLSKTSVTSSLYVCMRQTEEQNWGIIKHHRWFSHYVIAAMLVDDKQ